MARPSLYTDDMIDRCNEYLLDCELKDKLPTIEGLAVYLNVMRKTLYNWANDPKKSQFLHTFEIIKAKQAEQLIQRGLKNEYNSTIAKLILTNHGYSDKQQVESTNTHSFPDMDIEEIDNRLREMGIDPDLIT